MQSIRIRALLLVCLVSPAAAWARVKVVASIPTLGSLAAQVGGDLVEVTSLAPATSDPHFVDGRPSYVVALRSADLLIHVGLDLEVGWLPPLVENARNRSILPGSPGNLDAATVAGPLIGVTQSTDRARGDVHAGGNPHYLLDPRMAVNVALAIARRLTEIDPANAAAYRAQAAAFKQAMVTRIATWQQRLAAHKGAAIVTFHDSAQYLTRWLGLRSAGTIEPLPGISPTPGHLAAIILAMRKATVRVVLTEAWYDAKTARLVAEKAGAQLLRLPGDVGAPGVASYQDVIEVIVSGLAEAL